MLKIVWTDYLEYRAKLRGFDVELIGEIIRYGSERYFDTITNRHVVIGKHFGILVMIAYETTADSVVTPVTIHAPVGNKSTID